MVLRAIVIGIFFLTLAGCVSGRNVLIPNQNISLGELKTLIHQLMPGGIQNISANGREFVSAKFIVTDGTYQLAKDARTRYFARILVLNSTRPYDIEIDVHKEMRDDEDGTIKFIDVGTDRGLTNLLRTQIKDRLAKRRDDLNLLDDFRVF
jgi:hypothetical protein